MRFSLLSRHQALSSASPGTGVAPGDYASASSTSDTRSFASSAFTLSSVTSASSVDSSLSGVHSPKHKDEPGSVNPFVAELKRVYREISVLEKKLLNEEAPVGTDEDDGMVRVQGPEGATETPDEIWIKLISSHKAYVMF